jgi:hypothetical protein
MSSSYLKISLLAIAIFLANPLQAQEKTRVWNTFSLGMPLTDKLDARVAYLHSTDITDEIKNNFNWYQVRLAYRINSTWSTRVGTAWLSIPSSNRTTNRLFVNAIYRKKLNRRLVLRSGVQFETHSQEERRFDHRVILSNRLGLRKRLDFLGVAPSLTYSLFYNIGGGNIRYFNDEGEEIARKPANGFHRGRILANFNFKISDPIRLSLYYMHQHEFNLGFSATNKINVLNPNTGRIQRPFNNYHVIGMSVSYQLKGKHNENFLPINF